jgi:ATP/maltotriose-dependent transcriptional regulator MalT
MAHFEIAEPLWMASANAVERGYVMGCRSFIAAFEADSDTGLQYSYRALAHFPQNAWVSRMRLWAGVCEKEFWRGNDDLATHAFRQAEHCRRLLPAEQRWWTLQTESTRINQYAIRGNLPTAERLYQAALEGYLPQFREAEGRTRFRMAAIYLEWNDLARAQAEVDRFMRDPERYPWQFWYPEAWLIAARVALESGRVQAARVLLNQLFGMVENYGESHTTVRARALRAQLWLEQGELLLVGAWADRVQTGENNWSLTFGETEPLLVLLQFHMFQHDFESVLSLATTRIEQGRAVKRNAELVSLYAWRAAALQALGRTDEAIGALRAALSFGMPGGFNRSFFPRGVDLTSFYRTVKTALSPGEGAYLDRLLSERREPEPAGVEAIEEDLREEAPGELLSPREREILGLIRDGFSSRDIAERLFITESTIKKHLTRSFLKLSVTNRTAAAMRAQELGLLS